MATKTTEQSYPSLPLAYELIMPTFDIVLKRLEAVERRVDNILRFGITFSLAVGGTVVAIQSTLENAVLFPGTFGLIVGLTTILLFLTFLIIGMSARTFGKVQMLDLSVLYESYIQSDINEYRQSILYRASRMIEYNQKLINRKAGIADWVVLLFVLELTTSLAWIWRLLTP